IGSAPPQGWGTQIQDEAAFQYRYQFTHRCSALPPCVDLTTGYSLEAGNILDRAGAPLALRLWLWGRQPAPASGPGLPTSGGVLHTLKLAGETEPAFPARFKDSFSFSLVGTAAPKLVGYNGTMEGGLWTRITNGHPGQYVLNEDQIRPLVLDTSYGFNINVCDHFTLDLLYVDRSPEFSFQPSPREFYWHADLALAKQF
ncbi:MAG TPA: lipid A-modifier LpxR family protein, partial [bacterium]|nr:lipid A-modifier LpxR family protein [bacterium]